MHVLVIGDSHADEMQSAVAVLSAIAIDAEARFAAGVAEAIALARDEDWHPDLIIVCQRWPDEYSIADVRELFSRYPLARYVCCYGAWCESDGRTRDIWPHAVRVPARAAEVRIAQEFEVVRGIREPLPLTASRDETYEYAHGNMTTLDGGRSVRIKSPDPAYRTFLRDACTAAGLPVLADANGESPSIVLCDIDPWRNELAEEIATLKSEFPSAQFVALSNFAHPEDVRRAKVSGFAAVVSKLAPLDELLQTLARHSQQGQICGT